MQAAPEARPTRAEDDTANALLAARHAVQREMNYTSTLYGPAEKDKYVNQDGAARQRTPTGCEDSLARKYEKTTEKTTRRKNEKTKLLKKGNPESGGGENPKNHKKSMPIATASEGSQRRPQRSSEAEQRQLPRANFI